jgi:hypothetical protein
VEKWLMAQGWSEPVRASESSAVGLRARRMPLGWEGRAAGRECEGRGGMSAGEGMTGRRIIGGLGKRQEGGAKGGRVTGPGVVAREGMGRWGAR